MKKIKNGKRSGEDALVSNILELAKGIKALVPRALEVYAPQVNEIIVSGCRDERRIERTLDGMLSFCWDDQMLELYRKLCRYYYAIDARAAAGYVYAYRDMWDDSADRAGTQRPLKKRAEALKLPEKPGRSGSKKR